MVWRWRFKRNITSYLQYRLRVILIQAMSEKDEYTYYFKNKSSAKVFRELDAYLVSNYYILLYYHYIF